MSSEQKNRILQILYDERAYLPYMLDREELAERIGKRWHEIQPDVADLEKKGYLLTEQSEIRSRTFYILHITPEGSEFVENGMRSPFRKIDVFISSPGDVSEERQIAKKVIERCNRLHSVAERFALRLLAYEESAPAEIGNRPQTVVDRHMMKAGSSDLFICILWHRMGTPVFDEQTGERFQSGTEYEFLDAYHRNQEHGKPYILLYRGMKPFPPEMDQQQLSAVQAFFKRFEGEQSELKGLYKVYHSNEEFEDMLFRDIDTVLAKDLIG
jgi:DNA-binding MarR family transcriptional regulator